ncbi:transposase [Marinifilum fragile]|uniref:transposase n=1 Tax=Marinifilum fragile TaxID=570161 RepID=UPI002AA6A136|nr:transposase [Marinifilum fragile]
MTQKFQNKYRIASARLKDWDYGSNAIYFVTICTQNREHYFGEIANGKMQLNAIGELVQNEWIKTPELRPDMNLELGEFVVMPNHFHAIITIGKNNYNTRRDAMPRVLNENESEPGLIAMPRVLNENESEPGLIAMPRVLNENESEPGLIAMPRVLNENEQKDAKHGVSTFDKTKNNKDARHGVSTFGAQSKNLASIIRGFKSSVTVMARKTNSEFAWQSRFHDHIIRDFDSYHRIEQYIQNNPARWKEDEMSFR